MNKIFFLNTPTAFIILLATNVANPLFAFECVKPSASVQVQQASIHQAVTDRLIDKGLERHVAMKKVSSLLENTTEGELLRLQKHKTLNLTADAVLTTLSSYALFDKTLSLNDYDALTGFIQDSKGVGLSSAQRSAINEIALQHKQYRL